MINEVLHIYPLNDINEHFLECIYPITGYPYCPCSCKPEFKEENDNLLILHNSYDGREQFEIDNPIRQN